MSEQGTTTDDNTSVLPDLPEELTEPYDPTLEFLITSQDHGLGAFGITLLVGGAQVSGQVVGAKSWLDQWEDQLRRGGLDDDVASMICSRFRDQYATVQAQDRQRLESEQAPRRREFIHLRDVRFLDAPPPHNEFTYELWRVRLSEVTGWTLATWGSPTT